MPTQDRSPGKGDEVLILSMGGLREFILSLGAVEAIRRHHPRTLIAALVAPAQESLARLCPHIDVVEDGYAEAGRSQRAAMTQALRKHGYKAVYDLDGDARAAELGKAMKGRLRSGPIWHAAPPEHRSLAAPERHALVLGAAGITASAASLAPDLHWVRALLGDPPKLQPEFLGIRGTYALIGLTSAPEGQPRRWPLNLLTDIVARLDAAKIVPVLTGPREAGPLAQQVQMKVRGAVNLIARGEAVQLIALSERCALAIGPDSAAVQLAGLYERPTIILNVEKAPPREQSPVRGGPSITITAPDLASQDGDTLWRAISQWTDVPGGGTT